MAEPSASAAARTAWQALAILLLTYILAFVDRQTINLLVEPIKRTLAISDLHIGLLQGLSFALCLSIAGLPLGRLLDMGIRVRILAIAVAVWSLATAASGLAGGFALLLLCRIGVGVGEAAMNPAAYSLIGDYFPPRRQGTAIALYNLGPHLGSGLALILGAAVIHQLPAALALPIVGRIAPWQLVFVVLGIPGLLVAALVAGLREPPRGESLAVLPLSDVITWFHKRRAAVPLVNGCVAFTAVASYGVSAWVPALIHRQFGVATIEIGMRLGPVVIAAGVLGVLTAGLLGDRLVGNGRADGRIRLMVLAAALAIVPLIAAVNAATFAAMLPLLGLTLYFLIVAIGSGPATLQQMTPPRLRGVQHAIAVLAVNLIGLGLGPTIVGLMSTLVLRDEARLALAMTLTLPCALVVAVVLGVLALAPYRRAVASVA